MSQLCQIYSDRKIPKRDRVGSLLCATMINNIKTPIISSKTIVAALMEFPVKQHNHIYTVIDVESFFGASALDFWQKLSYRDVSQ